MTETCTHHGLHDYEGEPNARNKLIFREAFAGGKVLDDLCNASVKAEDDVRLLFVQFCVL
jgi:hypothetical protein